MLNQKCVYGSLEIVGRSVRLSFLKAWALSVMGTEVLKQPRLPQSAAGEATPASAHTRAPSMHAPPRSALLVRRAEAFSRRYPSRKPPGWDLQQFCSHWGCGSLPPWVLGGANTE